MSILAPYSSGQRVSFVYESPSILTRHRKHEVSRENKSYPCDITFGFAKCIPIDVCTRTIYRHIDTHTPIHIQAGKYLPAAKLPKPVYASRSHFTGSGPDTDKCVLQ